MKHAYISRIKKGFRVLLESSAAQGAVMVLQPGESTGDRPENEHPGAEQWLYVASGTGTARSRGRTIRLKAGSLLLIARNEAHQITNNGSEKMVTVNLYAPPAYSKDGQVRRSVRK